MNRRPILFGAARVAIRRVAQTLVALTLTILAVPLIPPEPALGLTSETPCNQTSSGVTLTVTSPIDFVPGETVRISGHLGQTHTAAGQGLPFQPIDIEIIPEGASPEAVMATPTASDGPEMTIDRDPGRFYKLTTDQNGDFNARPRLTQAVDYILKVRYRPLLICNTVEIPVRTQTLTLVGSSGTGTGKVSSEPTGIDCGVSCTATFVAATTVNLTPTPEEGNTFSGWSAPCEEGNRVCKLQMTSDVTITANFRGGIYKQIAAGGSHTCGLLVTGTVSCWGDNSKGQLGIADGPPQTANPTAIPSSTLKDVIQVSAGASHTCALIVDGTVTCWGDNAKGQLGQISHLVSVTAISAGDFHTCALIVTAEVNCWGDNSKGQLGDGSVSNVKAMAAGGSHTCALIADGTVRCWGDNSKGQLGDGSVSNVKAMAAGGSHTCALIVDGTAKCWGSNSNGQLGNGAKTISPISKPVEVKGLTHVRSISAGGLHTCVLLANGTAACWGSGASGQVGDGGTNKVDRTSATGVLGFKEGIFLEIGSSHSCAVSADGGFVCWGKGEEGRLGDGTTSRNSKAPTFSNTLPVLVTSGAMHACILNSDGTVSCVGYNASGQLGDGTFEERSGLVGVPELSNAISVQAGADFTCALIVDGSVKCWGDNTSGQLGPIGSYRTPDPITVSGPIGVSALSLGNSHACALVIGSVKCWGDNHKGQLGDGSYNSTSAATQAVGLSAVLEVASGSEHSCARLATGVLCWGDNHMGQLGDGTTTTSAAPVTVVDLAGATSIWAGGNTSCAIRSGAAPRCWGGTAGSPAIGRTIALTVSRSLDEPSICSLLVDSGTFCSPNTTSFSTAISISLGEGFLCVLSLGGGFDCDSNLFTPILASGTPKKTKGVGPSALSSSGDAHNCAVVLSGKVLCWGDNGSGQLGNPAAANSSSSPVEVIGISDAASVSAGSTHSCALLSGGKIKCWGDNFLGQLGNPSAGLQSSTPVEVIGISDAASVSAGTAHSCALLSGGKIKCWGNGVDVPFEVREISDATHVSAGGHTCAVLSSGKVMCWGRNQYGQLGNGTTSSASTPVEVLGISEGRSVAAGLIHTCATLSSGRVKCWGNNDFGQLGDGTTTATSTPVEVGGLADTISVSAGTFHACGVISGGRVSCWGYNGSGQLGHATSASAPVEVIGISEATSVSAGGSHSCAVLLSHELMCWGSNRTGQLANPSVGSGSLAPFVQPLQISGATSVSAGLEHTCATLSRGNVKCWGNNGSGQLGDGTTASTSTPTEVFGISQVTSVSAGSFHTCAALVSGRVMCWGDNSTAQLGNQGDSHSTPVEAQGVSGAASVSSGNLHTCAVLFSGKVMCWGTNYSGQLGNGTTASDSIPVEVMGISDATSVSAGGFHSCAVLGIRKAMCWGSNRFGQLGNPAAGLSSPAPVEVTGLSEVISISAGGSHTCAVLSNGKVECWGSNRFGQLGNPSAVDSVPLPIEVPGISHATLVSASGSETPFGSHTCSVDMRGKVMCWGDNSTAQLGNQGGAFITTPVEVVGLTDATSTSAGHRHSCAIEDEFVVCWGEDKDGQRGLGTSLSSRKRIFGPQPYRGPTRVSPCEIPKDPNACILLKGNEARVKVIVDDQAAQTANRDHIPAGVAGFVIFLDNAGEAIGTESFCGFGQFQIPPGSYQLAIELYEGGSSIPIANLGAACDVSAPTQGTIILAFKFGNPGG